ncbi:hypothetical protein BX661DRAFT_2118 [Kickxella alabastrina]|uniref:uncharacterized protein n=1 Tax=Kickxella alabastrina TaxID=61397 RepID=UPI00221E9C0E|nr:uncharacterized protein BX661DRAFT_2118 [Kickxella alabastrina]KAI7834594.1 hypothetical protein BX661DRAFT_2118 [Kickxella alabastrina]
MGACTGSKEATDHFVAARGPARSGAQQYNSRVSGMVWTKGRPIAQSKSTASMKGAAAGSLPKLDAEHIVGDEADEDIEDIDDEEEWLLEQGIDWRSDPQVLRQRREWLQRQKAKVRARERAKSGQFGRDSNSSFGNSGPENLQDVLYIAEPGSGGGALYLYTLESGLHRLPLTIQDLVDRSPVQVNGVLYTGTKDTHFVAVDLSSGQLLSLYESEGSSGARVLLGEKRNRVRITPTTANSNGIRQSALNWDWELHHRSVDAPALDAEIDALLVELGDAAETLSGARGPAKFVTTHDGGFVMVEAQTGMPLWAQRFDSPVVVPLTCSASKASATWRGGATWHRRNSRRGSDGGGSGCMNWTPRTA